MASSDSGYILIADITGYTRFLQGSELDHARGILEGLFAAMLKEMKSPFALSNVQGDAILAHARADQVADGNHVIDVIESLYSAFAGALEDMIGNTTCTCNACRNMANLDLKLLVHFGPYAEQSIAGRIELSGPEVILTHRLLKNTITATTGIRAYAAFTEPAVAAIALPDYFAQARTHTENTDDFGAVPLRVLDMQPVWEARKARRNLAVAEADRLFEDVSVDLPVPPDRAWYYLTHPDRRGDWITNVVKTTRMQTVNGRTQPGSYDHCAHGDGSILIHTIVEWRPFERATLHLRLPLGAYCPYTFFLEPTTIGCHIVGRTGRPIGPDPVRQAIVRLMTRRMAPKLRQDWLTWFGRLAEVAERDAAEHDAASAAPPEQVMQAAVASRLTAG